jgi:UDP-4-amino-4,6-dideoxy-N-acetyl-beta-L-altrosamine transaminase
MIPYGRHHITEEDVQAVVDVLRSDWLTQGPMVPRFEQELANISSVKHAIAVNSATSALHIACLALDICPGDIVWTSPITYVASANCVQYCGAEIDFVDIDPLSYNMSTVALEEKLKDAFKSGRLPKVVIPVHFSGQSCNMHHIKALSEQYGFRIIEDASHSIGSSYLGELVGNCRFSDITVFSFHPVKIITTGEGGIALTNNSFLAERMELYRSHGVTSKKEFMLERPMDEIWNYQQIALGFNYRMTDIQAALGISQLKYLNKFIQLRRQIAKTYDDSFSMLPILMQWQSPDSNSSYHLYPIRIRKSLCGKNQKFVYDFLRKSEIAANLHYIPVYRHPYYETKGFGLGYCKEAELYYKEVITLPIFPGLTRDQQNYIINTVKQALIYE